LVCSSIATFDVKPFEEPDFRAQLRAADLGLHRVVKLHGPETHLNRTRKHVRQSELDYYKIDLLTGGRLVADQEGRQVEVRPGDFTLVDFSRPGRWCFLEERHSIAALLFPHSLLPFRPNEVAQHVAALFSGTHGTGGLISSLLNGLTRHVSEVDAAAARRVAVTVLDLFTDLLARRLDRGDAVSPEAASRALLARIDAHIEQRLSDPALSPADVAAAFHISTRRLQKLFESQDRSVAAWIRGRRLERCRAELVDPALARHPVCRIGEHWGFADPGHFSRLFKNTFGLPPGEYRRVHLPRDLDAD
jgi:AraC-like DNA-binding protein